MGTILERTRQHIRAASDLGELPEMRGVMARVEKNPKEVALTYVNYLRVVKRLMGLDETEVGMIAQVNQRLGKNKGADRFLGELTGTLREEILGMLQQMENPNSHVYKFAMSELRVKMEKAQDMKRAGLMPVDGDPKSDQVIWGYTVINGDLALVDFTVCHFMDRFLAAQLRPRGVEMAWEKDFLISAMTDVLALDAALNHENHRGAFLTWARKKEDGGLGWINLKRMETYFSVAAGN